LNFLVEAINILVLEKVNLGLLNLVVDVPAMQLVAIDLPSIVGIKT
jgi:hypothetical protein